MSDFYSFNEAGAPPVDIDSAEVVAVAVESRARRPIGAADFYRNFYRTG